jgi:dienelactone hydrolase
MRAFELLLLLACAAFSIRMAGGRAGGWMHGIQLTLAVVLLVQLLLEGWRWQVFPTYAATLVVALTPIFFSQSAIVLLCSAAATFSLLGAAVVASLVFPFVEPRVPQGPLSVGTSSIAVTVVHSETEPAELRAQPQVQLWYPTQHSSHWHRVVVSLTARVAAGLRAVPTAPVTVDAPIARVGREFPVILYFDGWPEDKTQNVNLILELVSRGFAVASVTWRGIDRPLVDYSSDEQMQRSVDLDHQRTRSHARDGMAALDALTQANERFGGALDSQHASALGFSFGGAVAAQLARIDSRVISAINLDGRHWADALESGVSKPYMFICEELIVPSDADVASPVPSVRYEARLDRIDYAQLDKNQVANGGIRVTLPGVAHMNFTDIPLRSPLKRFSLGSKLDAQRVQDIIHTYAIDFFERYGVPGRAQPPLDTPWPRFPEAQLRIWPAPR